MSRYGGWQDLIINLEALAVRYGLGFTPDPNRRRNDFLTYVDDIRDSLQANNEQDRYYHYLTTTYAQTVVPYDELHSLLVSLPFSGIMTTNYDPCFGAAIAASDQGAFEPHRLLSGGPPTQWDEWLSSLDRPHSSQRLILHCHGYYSVPESIVLSARDYKQLYGPLLATSGDTQPGLQLRIAPTEAAQFIRSVLMVKTVLFIGFSMDDPYFQGFLEFVMRALWRYDPTRARAVLLLSADSGGASGAARHLGDSYGIHAYLYDPVDSSHSGLLNLFRSVADRCGTTTLSRPAHEQVGSWWKERFTIARLRTEVR